MPFSLEKSIFLNAVEIEDSAEREAFLIEACAGDAQLKASIQDLLAAHTRPGNVLDLPPADVRPQGDADATSALPPAQQGESSPIAERPGSMIGPYKLLEQIGEGGFGLVFVAEQQRPVRRRVALKIIKPGMDTREVIARLEAERQALALMDHPNIAQVFDAGATDAGRPYMVMELVRGVPITEFCDRRRLDACGRLELFISVCLAVQHAHQKGVIHRDIKPSNVLVTMVDGAPIAKVIDFGVAKAVGQRLTDKTVYTRFTAMVGTPLYMSPEQAAMSAVDVDTRSDIYALGVLLYELLTGTTPFDRKQLESAGFDEVRRIIREQEPPRPSTRLSTLGDAISTVSAMRSVEPAKLRSLVRGDLDWIVMKAIDKDRSRRYETAGAFAADVRRYLNEEPVEARPPTPLYRFRKFAQRHKVTMTSAALVATALIVGAGVSVWQAAVAVDERNEKERALADAVQAREEANDARKEVEGFAEMLKEANLLLASARAHADSERWAAANLDNSLATELAPNYYLVWIERGSLYARLGLWELAAADYARALDLGAPADGPGWWSTPQLFWYTGDKDRYLDIRNSILADAESSAQDMSFNEIRSCLAAPLPVEKAMILAKRADAIFLEGRPFFARRRGPAFRESRRRPDRDDFPGDGGESPPELFMPPRLEEGFSQRFGGEIPGGAMSYVSGWAHYRADEFKRAAKMLERADMDDPRWPGRGIGLPVLAMAYHREGRSGEAEEALVQAGQLINRWTEEMSDRPLGSMPIPRFDWLEILLTYREASTLITGAAPAEDPRFDALKQRALAAINGDDASNAY